MYEETKSSFDWKGLFLKVIIVFLVILIGVTTYKTLKTNNKNNNQNNAVEVTDSKNNSTFTSNMEKLRTSGKSYFEKNKDKSPTKEGITTIVTLNELIKEGYITELVDEEGKKCDGESSYVTASLDGKNTKIKANLVCGNASTYSTVYLNNNSSTTIENTKSETTSTNTNKTTSTETNKTTSTNTSSSSSTNKTTNTTTSNSTNKTNSTTCTSNCVPQITVNTNVSQNVIINENTNKDTNNKEPETVYYIVKFDSDSNKSYYADVKVEANNTVNEPSNPKKTNCDFKGWYYNGKKYDFSTPVTKNMTLIANYTCNYENDYEEEKETEKELKTEKLTTYVYSIINSPKGTEKYTVNHTLRLPEKLEELDIYTVRIADISYVAPITSKSYVKEYFNKFDETFIYKNNGWESTLTNSEYLSKITAYDLTTDDDYDNGFKYNDNLYRSLKSAIKNGFDVSWGFDSVTKQCDETFTVKTATNLCNYGIKYKVTWEYTIYE